MTQMQRHAYEVFLTTQHLATSAIATRLKKAEEAEDILGQSLAIVVSTDDRMRKALLQLRLVPHETVHGQLQNAVRKYYRMVHGVDFPPLRHCK